MAIVEYRVAGSSVTPEKPVSVFLNGQLVVQTQGSPHDLGDLGVGYLFTEGILSERDSLKSVEVDSLAHEVRIWSEELPPEDSAVQRRASSGQSSSRLRCLAFEPTSLAASFPVNFLADDIVLQMDELCNRSPHRNAGNGVHGCGLGGGSRASLLLVREDLGRHNAMDKTLGRAWLDGVDFKDKALFITGRISAEMAMKACVAGVPLLVSRKSATEEAVARAQHLGITLVSHCRNNYLRVLTHPERIRE